MQCFVAYPLFHLQFADGDPVIYIYIFTYLSYICFSNIITYIRLEMIIMLSAMRSLYFGFLMRYD